MTQPAAARAVDPDFLALPLDVCADAAIDAARGLGATHVDVRIERTRTGVIGLRDSKLESQSDDTVLGIGVRVVVDGTWGFASSPSLDPAVSVQLAHNAVLMAKTSKPLSTEFVELVDEPVYQGSWVSSYRIDPFEVSFADRLALLCDYSDRLLKSEPVSHVEGHSMFVKEQKFYADSHGTRTSQQRVRMHTAFDSTSVGDHGFESMRTLAQPAGFGWEWMDGSTFDWDSELALLPGLLHEKTKSPQVEPGRYTLVVHPSNLWLTIHESIGHATELDRAIGYEANYAGTSFATLDQLGKLQYGSPLMNITGDRVVEHGLSTVGWDDEGVAAQQWDIIKDGVLVGYQLDRRIAPRLGADRSNGCAFADSPAHVPIQRMPNVSLQPAAGGPDTDEIIADVEDGIYVLGDNSWSIDMQRYNFQFTGQQFHRIKNGRLVGQLRNVAYQATTTDFWGSMAVVGGPQTYVLGGAFNCGKGQPGQVAAVSHGCPTALFTNVNILNTAAEAGA